MCYQNHNFVFQDSSDAVFENVMGNLWIDSTQWIIQKIYVSIRIHRSRKTYPCLLSSRDVDSPLSNDSLSTFFESLNILDKLRCSQCIVKLGLIKLKTHQYVLFYTARYNERFLLNISNSSINLMSSLTQPSLLHDGV